VMRRFAIVVMLMVAVAPVGFGTPSGPANPTSTRVATLPAGPTPIQHVVVIYQENHTFDNVLGVLCAQNALTPTRQPCDGTTQGQLYGATGYALTRTPDVVPVVPHKSRDQNRAIDGGKMDGFSLICPATTNYRCLSQYYPDQVPNISALANRFAISDRTFEMDAVPSFGGHLEVAAQTLDGFTGDNPRKGTTGTTRKGWGCDSGKDVAWGPPTTIFVPACVPATDGSGPYRPSPVPSVPTLMDRMTEAGVSWKIYKGALAWTFCPAFASCLYSTENANMVPGTTFAADAAAGTLPAVSLVSPLAMNSQHNGYSMLTGDNYIGALVQAVETGPDWASTAIFITYDDCGCFYDHVPPPGGQGIRVPLVIVSPYVKQGFTDSTVATQSSWVAFTEHVFGLTPLTSADANAYDYADSFDFTQTPLNAVSMVQSPISQATTAYIASHPPDEDDPT
jgi:phospholipase C